MFLIGILLAGGALGLHYFYLDYTVAIEVAGYSAQPPLSLVLLSLVVLAILLILFWKLLSLIIFFPIHWKRWQTKRKERKRIRLVSEGMQSLVLGISSDQNKGFKAAADAGVAPAAGYFLAAAASKDEKKQIALLRKSAKSEGDSMVKAMATAQLRLKENQPAEACEVLRVAGAATHKANQPLRLLLEALDKSGDARGAFDVAQTLLDRDPTPALRAKVKQLSVNLIKSTGSPDDVHGLLTSVSKSSGSSVLAIEAAKQLGSTNDIEGATTVLLEAWKKNHDPEVLEVIAKYGTEQAVKKLLTQADTRLAENPNNQDLMLAFAELAMREKLYGQARKLLNDAIKIKEKRSIYLSLARLADLEGKDATESNRLYKLAAQTYE